MKYSPKSVPLKGKEEDAKVAEVRRKKLARLARLWKISEAAVFRRLLDEKQI